LRVFVISLLLRPEGPLVGQGRLSPSREQPEALVEAGGDLLG